MLQTKEQVLAQIIKYLATQPYSEVHQAIPMLANAPKNGEYRIISDSNIQVIQQYLLTKKTQESTFLNVLLIQNTTEYKEIEPTITEYKHDGEVPEGFEATKCTIK